MIDHEQIYGSEAVRYDLLVSREDYQGHILPALQEIQDLAGLEVAELGAGSGRLTLQIAPLVSSVRAFDSSAHMLDFAVCKSKRLGITNTIFQAADNRSLPLEDGSVDLCLSGWSIGYFATPDNPRWKKDVDQTLVEMRRILRPGGAIVILETLGTGVEQQYGFDRTWIRTDYCFLTVEEGQRIVEFFFGEPLSSRVGELKLTVLPECTGIWWLRL